MHQNRDVFDRRAHSSIRSRAENNPETRMLQNSQFL